MKKFTVLVALALLAATGTSYAVTCSTDNVPGATLLVPYFNVTGSAAAGAIPGGGVDTMVAITNVSQWGVIAHITVWNKQSRAVLDFNVPMTGFDVATFYMRDILNGKLNVNPNVQKAGTVDPCRNVANIGTGQSKFIRFTHPQYASPALQGTDYFDSIGYYTEPAFPLGGSFRAKILDSLDESPVYGDIKNYPDNDDDSPACGDSSDQDYTGSFTGYLTIDVVNYCTNWFPDQETFYTYEAIATRGWAGNGGPNVLMGDVFFIDPSNPSGNISGSSAVSLEFDERLEYDTATWALSPYKTFYGRYGSDVGGLNDTTSLVGGVWAFRGDGREPLGYNYGFRYLSIPDHVAESWVTVWRSDVWDADDSSTTQSIDASVSLCDVEYNGRQILVSTWDLDENQNTATGGGPSGDTPETTFTNVWWETNRISLYENDTFNPKFYDGGWTRWTFNRNYDARYHQAYVDVEHSAQGQFVSVGHGATLIDNQFLCPATYPFAVAGNVAY